MALRIIHWPPDDGEMSRELLHWFGTLHFLLANTGSVSANPGAISAGAVATFTIVVDGAIAGQTVLLGPPAALEAGLLWAGVVSANNTVTVRLYNSTGSPITPATAIWNARVMQ
jgi:hypothetical protein